MTTNSVEPLSFFVPRKSESFQEDLYPDTASNEPAHTADQWIAGSELSPKLMSLNVALGSAAVKTTTAPKAFVAVKSPVVLQAELDKANQRIKDLEARLAAAGLDAN